MTCQIKSPQLRLKLEVEEAERRRIESEEEEKKLGRRCVVCSAKPEEGLGLISCARCKATVYCSRACQLQEWRTKTLTCARDSRAHNIAQTKLAVSAQCHYFASAREGSQMVEEAEETGAAARTGDPEEHGGGAHSELWMTTVSAQAFIRRSSSDEK